MIRVLHIVTSMDAGGIETMLMNLYRVIDKDKIQFDFVSHRATKGFYDDEIKMMGGKIFYIPYFNIKYYFQYQQDLKEVIDNNKYSIVHSHINQYSYIPLRIAKKCDVKCRISHNHQAPKKLSSFSIKKILLLIYFKTKIKSVATDYFSCSQEAGKWLFGDKESFRIINNSIDSKKYIFSAEKRDLMRTELNLENYFTIGHIGNFSKAKNYPFILDVFVEVLKIDPFAKLVLIGKNENNPEVERRVKEMNLDQSVIFTGVRSDIPDLLQAIDVFLFPSLHEGLGLAIIEAQATGLKCVISETIPKEVKVTDNVECISLDESAEAWADRIMEYRDGYERKDTSQEIVAAGYDIQQSTKWLESFYLAQLKNCEDI